VRVPLVILIFNTAVFLFAALFHLPIAELPRPPWMSVLATLALWWCLIGVPLTTLVVGVLLIRKAAGVVLGLVWAGSLLLVWAGTLAFVFLGVASPFEKDLTGSYRFAPGDRLVLRPAREGEGTAVTASAEEAEKICALLRRARMIAGDESGVAARAGFVRDDRELFSFAVTRSGAILVEGQYYVGTEVLKALAGRTAVPAERDGGGDGGGGGGGSGDGGG